MTALVIHILTCNGVIDGEVCLGEYGGDPDVPSTEALREQAQAEGWHHAGARDLCPDCRKAPIQTDLAGGAAHA